jgi:signal transduction histidine kinase
VRYVPPLLYPDLAEPGSGRLLNHFITLPLADLFIVALPLSFLVAMLRYRLWQVDHILNRTLVYSILTLSIILIYVLVVGGIGALIGTRANLPLSLFATGLIAVVVQPLREGWQRTVNRLMYGERDEPVAVLGKLGTQLEAIGGSQAALPAITKTVAQALRLPFVGIEVGGEVVANAGIQPNHSLHVFPLIYQNEIIGKLLVAPRSVTDPLNRADQQLLRQVAAQAGTALHAIQLATDLQRSRERLVTTREEERRRLRRDLHDGLGPVLASQGLKLAAAAQVVHQDPHLAERFLLEVLGQNEKTVAEIRRLVYGLRPPALDELGLASAIQEEGKPIVGDIEFTLHISPDPLPPLSAAVEVAVYRIVMEALTNVSRHAQATRCQVWLVVKDNFVVRVVDDGQGMQNDNRPLGVGLSSMKERTDELGGIFAVKAGKNEGVEVRAELPLITTIDGGINGYA